MIRATFGSIRFIADQAKRLDVINTETVADARISQAASEGLSASIHKLRGDRAGHCFNAELRERLATSRKRRIWSPSPALVEQKW